MNAIEPRGRLRAGEVENGPPFEVRRRERLATPLIFASPHSGRDYPKSLLEASALDPLAIRRSEDAFVDELISGAFDQGVALLLCRRARVWVDVNREPWELDPSMFEEPLPEFARSQSARVAAGLGSIARVVAEGQEIYARKLSFADARRRIEETHEPYHRALAELVAEARAEFGVAVLIDWHSMPSAASRAQARRSRSKPDFVLGDRHGAACGRPLTQIMRRSLEAAGHAVALNAPYAGGFTTQTYGRPAEGAHTLQVEIDRGLYLDETRLEPSEGFERLKTDLDCLFQKLADADWVAALAR